MSIIDGLIVVVALGIVAIAVRSHLKARKAAKQSGTYACSGCSGCSRITHGDTNCDINACNKG